MDNGPGWETVKAVIVGGTEGGHDVVHLLAVRLQRLPLGNQVRVLPNLVQPGMLKILKNGDQSLALYNEDV